MTDEQDIGRFIDTIWSDAVGFVYLPTKDSRNDVWKKVFFEWPKHRDAVINYIITRSSQGLDVYIAPAIFSKPNPKKENVLGSYVLWTEFDGNAPEEWEPGSAAGPHDAVQGRLEHVPPPTIRVQSSSDGHEHVYWRLEEFTEDIGWVEAANKSIAYETHADTSGWDRNQILRPPGSRNYKHDLPVTIIIKNDHEYIRDNFKELKPPQILVDESIDTDNLPDPEYVVAKYRWSEEEFELFKRIEIPQGERSTALMRLGYVCAELGMDDAEAYSILVHADDRWGKFKNRDDRRRRFLDIIDRARQKHPVSTDELNFRGLLEQSGDVEINTQFVWKWRDFLNSKIEVEWIIEDLLERGGLGMVAGSPGVGKTQLTLQLGISCALGIPFLGWAIPRPLKVVFLSLEMSQVALKRFLDTISTGYDQKQQDILNENLQLVTPGEAIPLNRPEGLKFIKRLLNETKPDLLLIDSMNKITSGKLDEQSINDINRVLLQIRNQFGCSIWLVHHNRKANSDNRKPVELSDIYGSTFIAAELTTALIMWQDKTQLKQILEIIPVKSRLAELRDEFLVFREPTTLKFQNNDEKIKEENTANGDSGNILDLG